MKNGFPAFPRFAFSAAAVMVAAVVAVAGEVPSDPAASGAPVAVAVEDGRVPVVALRVSQATLLDRRVAERMLLLQQARAKPRELHPVRDALAAFVRVPTLLEHLPGGFERPDLAWIEFMLRAEPDGLGRPAAWTAVFPTRQPEAYRAALSSQTWIEPIERHGDFEHYRDNAPGRSGDLFLAFLTGNLAAFSLSRSDLVETRTLYEEGPWLTGRMRPGLPGVALRLDPPKLFRWRPSEEGATYLRSALDRFAADLGEASAGGASRTRYYRRLMSDFAGALENGLDGVSATAAVDADGGVRAEVWLRPAARLAADWTAMPKGRFGLARHLPPETVGWVESRLSGSWLRQAALYWAATVRETTGGFVSPELVAGALAMLEAFINAEPQGMATGLVPAAGHPDWPLLTARVVQWASPEDALDAARRLAALARPDGMAADWYERTGWRWEWSFAPLPSGAAAAIPGVTAGGVLDFHWRAGAGALPTGRERHYVAVAGDRWLSVGGPAPDPSDATAGQAYDLVRERLFAGMTEAGVAPSVSAALAETGAGQGTLLFGAAPTLLGKAALDRTADWRRLGPGEPPPESRRAAEWWSEAMKAGSDPAAPVWGWLAFGDNGDARVSATIPWEAIEAFLTAAGLAEPR